MKCRDCRYARWDGQGRRIAGHCFHPRSVEAIGDAETSSTSCRSSTSEMVSSKGSGGFEVTMSDDYWCQECGGEGTSGGCVGCGRVAAAEQWELEGLQQRVSDLEKRVEELEKRSTESGVFDVEALRDALGPPLSSSALRRLSRDDG